MACGRFHKATKGAFMDKLRSWGNRMRGYAHQAADWVRNGGLQRAVNNGAQLANAGLQVARDFGANVDRGQNFVNRAVDIGNKVNNAAMHLANYDG